METTKNDLILAALSNMLCCSILLYEHDEESDNYVITHNAHCTHPVRVSGTVPLLEIKLLHYSNQYGDALVQMIRQNVNIFFALRSH